MKIKIYKSVFGCLMLFILTTGCTKDVSYYYADNAMQGVAIFSNTGNNVCSCILNDQSWRTIDRKIGGYGRNTFEVMIEKQNFDSLTDLILIRWSGYYTNNKNDFLNITLFLSVAKNFSHADFSALQGKRLIIDGGKSHFLAETSPNNAGGSGTIYFNTVQFDSSSTNEIHGKLSGLMEANFGSFNLSSGRFDHDLEPAQVFFY